MGGEPQRGRVDGHPPPERTLISPASIAARAHAGRRLAVAVGAALLLLLFVVLVDPGGREIARRLTVYGAEGPLRVMPEISIDDGADQIYQKPRAAPQESAPIYEVVPEKPSPRATEVVPLAPAPPRERVDLASETVAEGLGEVEALLPRTTADESFIIRNMVRPPYPVEATEAERRRTILVRTAVFLDATGAITAAMVTYSEGSGVYDEVALAAVKQWVFEPVIRDGNPPAPRWLEISWRFKSPYGVS